MKVAEVHLLDVGTESYGDCLLLRFDTDGRQTWVLVDGGHRSDKMRLVDQFTDIMKHKPPFRVDLLLISHAHDDHIGALPDLVRDGYVLADYALIPDSGMAFGPPPDDDAAPDAVNQAIALLREEPPDDVENTEELDALAIDAASLRTRYDDMCRHLTNAGTDVVLFGSSSTVGLARLRRAFTHIGFNVLGPSQTALNRAAELLRGGSQDVIDAATASRLTGQDSGVIVSALDAQQRLGHLVNAQSVVCTFSVPTPSGPRNILLGGDFQFASLGTSDETLKDERDRLLKSIAEQAPYVFAKLSHHGSGNAVSPAFLDAIGSTDVLGICCGRGHPAHPDPDTLQLLNQRAASPTWIRTDRSGHLKVRIEADGYAISPGGATNIVEPNAADTAAAATVTRTMPMATPAAAVGPQPRKESMAFEIPARATSVTIKLDLLPAADTASGTAQLVRSEVTARAPTAASLLPGRPTLPSDRPTLSQNQFEIGGGRDLPRLLFLTDRAKLGEHITPNMVATIIDAIGRGGHRVCDVADVGASTVDDIAAALRARIDEQPPEQVVILGGYDVIPSQCLDTFPPEMRGKRNEGDLRAQDNDGFVVWSDDIYVDLDGNGLPEIPVSRIPDGHDALFTLKALQAEPAATRARVGIRNSAREFVIPIFNTLPGAADLLVSGPTDSGNLMPGQLDGSLFYCMLHGKSYDARRFWGEWRNNDIEAVNLGQLPTSGVEIAMLGCCWGALSASPNAADWRPGQPIVGRLVGQSIALSLLAAGARAVIGCTGAHWSPTAPPYNSASGPIHRVLWGSVLAGESPAAALMEAKYALSSRLRTITDARALAIVYKTLGQFICLGLGC